MGVFQLVLTSALVGSVLLISIGTFLSPSAAATNFAPLFTPERSTAAGILAMVAVAPWLYVGFDTLPQAAEELSFSHNQTRRLMVLSILAGAAMYIAVLLCTAAIGPWQDLVAEGSPWLTGATVRRTLGPIGLGVLGLSVCAGIFTGINGFYLASSRLLFSMGRAKLLPRWFATLHREHGTPHFAIAFAGALSLVAPWFGRQALLWVVDMSALGTAFGYAYTCIAAYILLKSRAQPTFLAVAGTLASLSFVVLLTIPGMPAFMSLPSWLALVGWIAMGIVFFIIRARDYRVIPEEELGMLILKEEPSRARQTPSPRKDGLTD